MLPCVTYFNISPSATFCFVLFHELVWNTFLHFLSLQAGTRLEDIVLGQRHIEEIIIDDEEDEMTVLGDSNTPTKKLEMVKDLLEGKSYYCPTPTVARTVAGLC